MRRIFEKFVLNFLKRRQSVYPSVGAERLGWSATPVGDSDVTLLPYMITDVILRSPEKTIIIECKYTRTLLQPGRFQKPKLRSAHLYQLCTYLRALEASGGPDANAQGILLYPAAGASFDECFCLHGHVVRIKTLDLGQHWTDIEKDLLSVLPAGSVRDRTLSCN